MTDSSASGVLVPAAPPAPLQGQDLYRVLQQWVSQVSTLPGEQVRPRWQVEPPNLPDAGVPWAAVGIGSRSADTYPYQGNNPLDGHETGWMQRQETLSLLCSFYDIGSYGQADLYASMMRDGAVLSQNVSTLLAQGINVAYVGDLTPVPSLLKEVWQYRIDLEIVMRRQIERRYPVLSVLSATGSIKTDVGIGPLPISVPAPTP